MKRTITMITALAFILSAAFLSVFVFTKDNSQELVKSSAAGTEYISDYLMMSVNTGKQANISRAVVEEDETLAESVISEPTEVLEDEAFVSNTVTETATETVPIVPTEVLLPTVCDVAGCTIAENHWHDGHEHYGHYPDDGHIACITHYANDGHAECVVHYANDGHAECVSHYANDGHAECVSHYANDGHAECVAHYANDGHAECVSHYANDGHAGCATQYYGDNAGGYGRGYGHHNNGRGHGGRHH